MGGGRGGDDRPCHGGSIERKDFVSYSDTEYFEPGQPGRAEQKGYVKISKISETKIQAEQKSNMLKRL